MLSRDIGIERTSVCEVLRPPSSLRRLNRCGQLVPFSLSPESGKTSGPVRREVNALRVIDRTPHRPPGRNCGHMDAELVNQGLPAAYVIIPGTGKVPEVGTGPVPMGILGLEAERKLSASAAFSLPARLALASVSRSDGVLSCSKLAVAMLFPARAERKQPSQHFLAPIPLPRT